MPVNSKHPIYSSRLAQWKKCRDVFEGSDAVKDAGTDYLPKPSGQDRHEYDGYKKRAMFYGAYARTIEGFIGSIARKPARLDAPEVFKELCEDVTATGISLGEYIKVLASEVIITGRVGVLADFDNHLNRPFTTYYKSEQIINWFGDGSIVIEEKVYEQDPQDRFKVREVVQYRLLSLEDGIYTVTVYRKSEGISRDDYFIYEQTTPNIRGVAFNYIPFFFLSKTGSTPVIEKPPLYDLAEVVLSHYRTSADLEHGRHFTALPTLYISGMMQGEEVKVGGGAAIVLADPQAKVGYAEFSGQGLASLDKGLEQKEHQMAILGASLFGSKGGVEAAETARIRTSGESSLLSSVVSSIEEALEKVLQIMADWMGVNYEIDLDINRDFVGERITAPEIMALVTAYNSGVLTLEAFLHNLQDGDVLPPELDIDEQAAELKGIQEEAANTAHDNEIKKATALAAIKTENSKPMDAKPSAK
jgi:hypothetical protein